MTDKSNRFPRLLFFGLLAFGLVVCYWLKIDLAARGYLGQ